MPESERGDTTYPLRAAARLTGLSPELLRAWERRYGAVAPVRTQDDTRRYRASDVERLRLLKAAVDAGYRIGQVAHLDGVELERRASAGSAPAAAGLEGVLAAIRRLDAEEAQRLLSVQFAAVGPVRFARELAGPLAREIGDRWADGRLAIASEHLATAVLRSLLGAALTPNAVSRLGPRIVLATLTGERHELGLQAAALTAMGAGANPIYLGVELPVEELVRAVEQVGASVLALSLVVQPSAETLRAVEAIRGGLPEPVRLWVGGAGSEALAGRADIERIGDLEQLERRVGLLGFEDQAR
jgi:MerR family transcriptional regulator, light-induced transcriptional regulator